MCSFFITCIFHELLEDQTPCSLRFLPASVSEQGIECTTPGGAIHTVAALTSFLPVSPILPNTKLISAYAFRVLFLPSGMFFLEQRMTPCCL